MYGVDTQRGPLRSKRKQSDERSLRPFGDGHFTQLGFVMNPVVLQPPTDVTAEMIEAVADTLFAVENSLQIWIGDLLAVAEQLEYGAITRLAEKFNREPKTLWNWKSTCVSIEPFLRGEGFEEVAATIHDYKILSMTHYKLLASLDASEQRHYMRQAMLNHWSVATLRQAINKPELSPLPDDSQLSIRKQQIHPQRDRLNQAIERAILSPTEDSIEVAIQELEQLRLLLQQLQDGQRS